MLLWPTPLLPLCRGVWKAVPFASQLFVGFFSSALKYLVLLYFHNNHNHTHPPPTPHSTTTDVCSKRKWRHWYNQGLVRVLSYQILQQIRNNNQKKKKPSPATDGINLGSLIIWSSKSLHFAFCVWMYRALFIKLLRNFPFSLRLWMWNKQIETYGPALSKFSPIIALRMCTTWSYKKRRVWAAAELLAQRYVG